METNMYGVTVVFQKYEGWSKPYTYKSDLGYDKDEAIIVPTGNWYSVGRVISSVYNYKFSEDVEYSRVIGSVKELKSAHDSFVARRPSL